MTRAYTIKQIEFAVVKNYLLMQKELPIKTGRLAYRAFKMYTTEYGWKIYIDLEISPYAIYLDEKPKTMGWWTGARARFLQRLAVDVKGIIKNG